MKIVVIDGPNIAAYIIAILIVLGACVWFRNKFDVGTDDSDKNGSERSGLRVYTDHATGVQYLGTVDGALTPRLNRDGTIRVNKESK